MTGQTRGTAQARDAARSGMELFNTMPADAAAEALLNCCASARWTHRLAEHRPYPDLDALLAAADESGYDLTAADLAEAFARERPVLPPGTPDTRDPRDTRGSAVHTALSAALAAYEGRFGHGFVICLDGLDPGEALDATVAGIRSRLGNDPEEERVVAAEELRRLARGRIVRLIRGGLTTEAAKCRDSADSGCPDRPYVPV